jgi:predicted alpha/beta-hydrolase family hydrolase
MTTDPVWRVETPAGAVSVEIDPAAADPPRALLVCAHGAGGSMRDAAMLALSRTLRDVGLTVARFNFPYRERGASRPDPMPKLLDTWTAVLASGRARLAPARLLIGGRSMGGRAASMLAASDPAAAGGLLLFAYPLHPPGQPEKLRSAHLPSIRVPVLCFNGTRDDFCRPDLMNAAIAPLGRQWTMHWLDGADHGFHVRKSSGRGEVDVLTEVGAAVSAWLAPVNREIGGGNEEQRHER